MEQTIIDANDYNDIEDLYKAKILFVDDDKDIGFLVEKVLKDKFEDITILNSSKSAIDILKQENFDVLITDLLMPEINGIDLIKKAKKIQPNLEFIITTADDSLKSAIQAMTLGTNNYLIKPINFVNLISSIKYSISKVFLKQEIIKKQEELEKTNADLIEQIEKQKATEKALIESNKTKNKMFSIISHDIKNSFYSMTAISQSLKKYLISKQESDKQVLSKVNQIYSNVDSTYKLLENLLCWSKLQMGPFDLFIEDLNVYQLVLDISHLFSQNASEKLITLSIDIDKSINIKADYNMTATILRNFISNAIKFSYPKGKIEIKSKADTQFIQILVKDYGLGISNKDLKNLFDIEKKYHQEGTCGEKGTGLGLHLCKEFAEKQNGCIKIKNNNGKGSTFILELPLRKM